jgi:V/A-type H+-transporting ATPase subunit A
LYDDKLENWYKENVADDYNELKRELMYVLQEESELEEIVRLVGMDALGAKDRLTMETAKSIREDYLHQNAFHEVDTFASVQKQYKMMKLILDYYHLAQDALKADVELEDLLKLPVREQIGRSKYVEEHELEKLDEINRTIKAQINALVGKGE